ncbi:LLM class flavin-dependent oxidoreductase [Frankia sp. AvcI1]|uniref:LLM class flavin-dependent oxidoreductase n=1 Tax=Frankia sp. AvcI1 TaxID=573496 RepID=UPI0021183625|nr:LLM class flavin-dependent oxidoreductase [Frankia sp. AvcI1]
MTDEHGSLDDGSPDRAPAGHRPLRFGTFLFPRTVAGRALLDHAAQAEELGYDLIAVPDHPYNPDYVDQVALLSAVVGRTSSIRVLTDVVNLALRPPAVLAKTAWTIDRLAPGRLDLGLGTGGLWDQIAAIGGPRWKPREARERLAEAIDVIRLLWSGDADVTYAGQYYQLDHPQPLLPPQQPIQLWIGSGGPLMRRLTAGVGAGWIPNGNRLDLDTVRADAAHFDTELAAAGRSRTAVPRLYNAFFGHKLQDRSEGFLVGPASQWIDELTALALELDFDTFVLGDRETPVEHLQIFADQVIPQVRAQVAAARP